MPDTANDAPDLSAIYRQLRSILEPYVARMRVVQDNARGVYLDTHALMKNGQPLFFASIAVNRMYVSFYVQAVDRYPDLLDGIGILEERLQGKSCFIFQEIDVDEVETMRALVEAGYQRFRSEGDI